MIAANRPILEVQWPMSMDVTVIVFLFPFRQFVDTGRCMSDDIEQVGYTKAASNIFGKGLGKIGIPYAR